MAQNSSHVVPFSQNNSIEIDGRQIALRPDGHVCNLEEWSPELATALAAKEGLTLMAQHWKVLIAMRDYYSSYNVSPVKKLLKRALKESGSAVLTSDVVLNELFPGGVCVQGSRIAGVPMPMLDAELERVNCGKREAVITETSHFVERFDFNGQDLAVTCTGNLLELNKWSSQLAEFMAEKEGIKLSDQHWEVLNFLRTFYFEYGTTPMVKILMKHMAEELGVERVSRDHLYTLFPKGPSRQGSRIAGLPEPQGCIDN